eukprot:gene30480-39729_t
MTILLHKSEKADAFDQDNTATKVSAMRQKLLFEFEKIDNDSKPVVAADILMFYVHISFSYGWISRASVGFLAVLSICPTAAKIRDANGCLPIHLICNHKTNRLADMDVLTALLLAYPDGALEATNTPSGDLNPLQMCLLSPQIHYEMVAAIVRVTPSSARVAFKGRYPLHLVLKNPAYSHSNDYDAMMEALQLMLEAHPRAAFLDIDEQSIQLRIALTPSVVTAVSPVANAPLSPIVAVAAASLEGPPSDDPMPRESLVTSLPVPPTSSSSSESYRLQISSASSEEDDADSGTLVVVRLHLGHGDSDRHMSRDQHVTTDTWSPYSKGISSSDPMIAKSVLFPTKKTSVNSKRGFI